MREEWSYVVVYCDNPTERFPNYSAVAHGKLWNDTPWHGGGSTVELRSVWIGGGTKRQAMTKAREWSKARGGVQVLS